MTEIQLLRPEGLFASPAFSHVAVVPPGATTVYVGGQNAVDQNGQLVGGTDVAAQTRQVMANLVTALQAAGAGIEHLVSVLVLLVEGVDVQAAYAAAAATLRLREGPSPRQRGDGVGAWCPRRAGGGVRSGGDARGLDDQAAALVGVVPADWRVALAVDARASYPCVVPALVRQLVDAAMRIEGKRS